MVHSWILSSTWCLVSKLWFLSIFFFFFFFPDFLCYDSFFPFNSLAGLTIKTLIWCTIAELWLGTDRWHKVVGAPRIAIRMKNFARKKKREKSKLTLLGMSSHFFKYIFKSSQYHQMKALNDRISEWFYLAL